jgi:hypothetical protein
MAFTEASRIQTFMLEAVLLLLMAAQINSECVHGKASLKDKSSIHRDVTLRAKNGRSRRIKLLGPSHAEARQTAA